MTSSPRRDSARQFTLYQSDSCGNLLLPSDNSYCSPHSESDSLHTPPFLELQPAPFLKYSPTFNERELLSSEAALECSAQENIFSPLSSQPRSPLYNDAPLSSYSSAPPAFSHPPLLLVPPYSPRAITMASDTSHIPDLNLDAYLHCPRFPQSHNLNPFFVEKYQLKDELGSGGYGFVMTAMHREEGYEVAVKFIIKSKVPDHAWMEDEAIGKLPSEVTLLCFIEHPGIVKCLDLFDDPLYFYMVQELHGTPWYQPEPIIQKQVIHPSRSSSSMPSLKSSLSCTSEDSGRSCTPPRTPSSGSFATSDNSQPVATQCDLKTPSAKLKQELSHGTLSMPKSLRPTLKYTRRPSHDLFECIEQSEHKRLGEVQARYVFRQVVDAVCYLDEQGVSHRDIKDENLVVDKDLNVKLIDFGSAIIVDPAEPRPFYTLFYGTAAYASSEILQKKPYQAAPAEVWTLGVLLSYLLTGSSPFPTVKDAIDGRIIIHESTSLELSDVCLDLMQRCLDPNPSTRATVAEVKAHQWLSRE